MLRKEERKMVLVQCKNKNFKKKVKNFVKQKLENSGLKLLDIFTIEGYNGRDLDKAFVLTVNLKDGTLCLKGVKLFRYVQKVQAKTPRELMEFVESIEDLYANRVNEILKEEAEKEKSRMFGGETLEELLSFRNESPLIKVSKDARISENATNEHSLLSSINTLKNILHMKAEKIRDHIDSNYKEYKELEEQKLNLQAEMNLVEEKMDEFKDYFTDLETEMALINKELDVLCEIESKARLTVK